MATIRPVLEGARTETKAGTTVEPERSTSASTHLAPTWTVRCSPTRRPTTPRSGNFAGGSGPRAAERGVPGDGGRPRGKSTSATGGSKDYEKNATHQMTNTLTRKFKHMVIEDLNVSE